MRIETNRSNQIGEHLADRLQEITAKWVEQDQIPPSVIAIALATVAGNLALMDMGRQIAAEWFHGMGDTVEREGRLGSEKTPPASMTPAPPAATKLQHI